MAREYGLPCLVGVCDVRKHFKTGKIILYLYTTIRGKSFRSYNCIIAILYVYCVLISGDIAVLDSRKGFVIKDDGLSN